MRNHRISLLLQALVLLGLLAAAILSAPSRAAGPENRLGGAYEGDLHRLQVAYIRQTEPGR